MKAPFSSLHARALCHATEVPDRVIQAVKNTVGEVEIETRSVAGHHGNEIIVVEAKSTDMRSIRHLFRMLSPGDRERLVFSLDLRLDDSCNLFIRIDKQGAYLGRVTLSDSDDEIALRIKVRAYPSKRDVAADIVADFVQGIASDE